MRRSAANDADTRLYLIVLRCQAGDESAFAPFTLLVMLVLVVITAWQVRLLWALQMPWGVGQTAMPLVIALGLLSTLIATLPTVGIFLRLRTASLLEIQLRLAALEEMLTRDAAVSGENGKRGSTPGPR